MLKFLFGRRRTVSRATVDRLYDQIVAAARQPELYSAWNVPDMPLGRFEMVALHVFLFLRRVRGEEGAIAEVAQELTDEFFRDVEHSIRELGISDPGVPKRMKLLARMFYGRVKAYGDALDAGDTEALSKALARNVRPGVEGWAEAAELAAYVQNVAAALAAQPSSALIGGEVRFPAPEPGPRSS
ncbi:ubiquinol-cytochrome C chaperone family protein [Rhizobiaceae sp. 2RAB30]